MASDITALPTLRDTLTGALIGLARAADGDTLATADTWRLMIEGLSATVPDNHRDEAALRALIDRVYAEKTRLMPDCAVCPSPCGRVADFDMGQLNNAPDGARGLRAALLLGLQSLALRAAALGHSDETLDRFFGRALFILGEDWDADELAPILMELGETSLRYKALPT